MSDIAISLPFTFDSYGKVAYSEDIRKIIQDRVVLILMTRLGERVMRPTYGTTIQSNLFENISDAMVLIEPAISGAFVTFLPGLTFISSSGIIDPDDGYLVVTMKYKYNRDETEQSVKLKTGIFTRSGDLLAGGS